MDRVRPKDRLKRGAVVVTDDHGKPTLSDLGITKDQSANWQKLAAMPEEVFDGMIDAFKNRGGGELTTRAMLMEATESLRGQGRMRGTREARETVKATEAETPPSFVIMPIDLLFRDEKGKRGVGFDQGYAATYKGKEIWVEGDRRFKRLAWPPLPSAEKESAAI